MLLTDKKKENGFRRLLEAGGGYVVTDKYVMIVWSLYANNLLSICLKWMFLSYLEILILICMINVSNYV